jgi:hypothetical protein
MILIKKHLTCFFLGVIAILVLVSTVRATAMSFTVQAGQEVAKTLDLAVDDHVQIRFTVTGQTTSTLGFYITDPKGNVNVTWGSIGNLNYAFVCQEQGEYGLHFSNAGSSEDKLVSLDYEVGHYIFGMPQMLFLTLIVVGICVAAVAAFILIGKTR